MKCRQVHRHNQVQREQGQAERQKPEYGRYAERGEPDEGGAEQEAHGSEDRKHDPSIPAGRKIYTPEVPSWHATHDLTLRSPS